MWPLVWDFVLKISDLLCLTVARYEAYSCMLRMREPPAVLCICSHCCVAARFIVQDVDVASTTCMLVRAFNRPFHTSGVLVSFSFGLIQLQTAFRTAVYSGHIARAHVVLYIRIICLCTRISVERCTRLWVGSLTELRQCDWWSTAIWVRRLQ